MSTVQLRRYRIQPGRVADFLAWWPSILPAREQYGFRVTFAVADHALETFTWAVEHDGDEAAFLAAEEVYDASPERAAAFVANPRVIDEMVTGFVEDVLPRPAA